VKRIRSIAKKEFIQITRDRRTLGLVFFIPFLLFIIFGYAVTNNITNVSTVVLDMDRSQESRDFVAEFTASGYFRVVDYVGSMEDVRAAIDSGRAKIGLVFPAGFSRDIHRGEPAPVQMLVDGSDPAIAQNALLSGQAIAQSISAQLLAARVGGARPVFLSPIDLRPRVWYNPSMDSVDFNIPGLVGLVLQTSTLVLTAFSLVRERERGTMEQLIVTPVRAHELMIGKLVPYVVIAFINVGLVLTVGYFWFGVPMNGSVWLLLALSFFFLIGSLGIGLFISTISKTQAEAMQTSMFVILPSILLSGFVFPREPMPTVLRAIGYGIPLTYFLKILRGIVLKGVGLNYLWPEVAFLAIFGVAVMGLAILNFRKRLG